MLTPDFQQHEARCSQGRQYGSPLKLGSEFVADGLAARPQFAQD